DLALGQLERFGLADYFISPQIGWSAKSASVRRIAEELQFGADAIAFVDDQPLERDEVSAALPGVLVLDGRRLAELPALPELNPAFVTEDGRRRRHEYKSNLARRRDQAAFEGPAETFLASLRVECRIRRALPADLMRAEELIARSRQLNSSERRYSHQELESLLSSPRHRLLMVDLRDRYGDHGRVGLAIIELDERCWWIRLLVVSCRVIAYGIGALLLGHVLRRAAAASVAVGADFVAAQTNRPLYVTYRLAGFRHFAAPGAAPVLLHDGRPTPAVPSYATLASDGSL